jgi:23S rRNA (cytosine1962-C5)-methyltransferase
MSTFGKYLQLKPGREHSVLQRHPWIFSGAVAKVAGEPMSGETMDVLAADGKWLARGAFSASSQICCRIWTFRQEEAVDTDFFQRRLRAAWEYRQSLSLREITDSWRLVHGEADGLPGCVIDKFGPFLSCQFLSAGAEYWRKTIVGLLQELPDIHGIYERSEAEARIREGLEPRTGLLWGEKPPERLIIRENGLKLSVNLISGHKTGYYLDQRANRRLAGEIAFEKEVLDCCCYSGGFGLQALRHQASKVTFLDSSEESLELVKDNLSRNDLPAERTEYLKADVFVQLRRFRDSGRKFDVIILDPPKFAETRSRLAGACRGYKDINLLALKLLRPKGHLLTFSCSAAMTPELFRKVVGGAVQDSNRRTRVCRQFSQDADHPLSLQFPEGDYLTGLELVVE